MIYRARAMCFVYVVILAVLSARTAAAQKVYINSEFGIRVPVPNQGFLCPTLKDERDHGFGILLGGGSPKDCHEDAHHRSIWLFAFFNALDETKHLSGLLKMGCDAGGGTCRAGPSDLKLPGLQSAVGRVDGPDRWIVIVVATQAGMPDVFDPNEPSVNYLFSLHTSPDHLNQDLQVFRTILETVKLGTSKQ